MRRHTASGYGLWLLVRRSLRRHALSTFVTVVATALATGLVLAVVSIESQSRAAFTAGPVGFDAVLGARGSQLQLVLNTVFHLETSPGNLPWATYQAIAQDPRIALAIPYAVGDNFQGFRIVGTTDELFSALELRPGEHLRFRPGGRPFDPAKREAVIGSFAAQRTGLGVGSTFHPYHGVVYDEAKRHDDEYVVSGVLEPTNTPSDRAIWIPIEGLFRLSGHVLRSEGKSFTPQPGETIPDEAKEVSAVMLKLKSPQAGFALDRTINKQGSVATLAWPIGRVMAELFDKLGWVARVLALVAYLVAVVAAAAILASLHNSMNERRRELAILRAIGARRRTVFLTIVCEAVAIASAGALLGVAVYAVLLLVAARIVRAETGVLLSPLYLHPVLVLAPAGAIVLGALAGLVPAFRAYRTDAAENLGAGA